MAAYRFAEFVEERVSAGHGLQATLRFMAACSEWAGLDPSISYPEISYRGGRIGSPRAVAVNDATRRVFLELYRRVSVVTYICGVAPTLYSGGDLSWGAVTTYYGCFFAYHSLLNMHGVVSFQPPGQPYLACDLVSGADGRPIGVSIADGAEHRGLLSAYQALNRVVALSCPLAVKYPQLLPFQRGGRLDVWRKHVNYSPGTAFSDSWDPTVVPNMKEFVRIRQVAAFHNTRTPLECLFCAFLAAVSTLREAIANTAASWPNNPLLGLVPRMSLFENTPIDFK